MQSHEIEFSTPLIGTRIVKIDEIDLPLLHSRHWFLARGGGSVDHVYLFSYAPASERPNGVPGNLPFHRVAINAPEGVFVDHANRDTLDNRRCNLRLATPAQNAFNRLKRVRSSTGFIGVYAAHGGKYVARVEAHRQMHHLGTFSSAIEAARARDAAARELHGEFAFLNFPEAA